MQIRLRKRSSTSISGTICLTFFAAYFLIRLFVVDTDNMTESYINRIVVPYLAQREAVLLLIAHCTALAGLAICQKIKIDVCAIILLMRIPLYFIPLLYCKGLYQWGVAFAVLLTLSAYIIGKGYREDIRPVVNCFLLASLVLCLQIFATLIINNISFFTEVRKLKWYMVLPAGKTNAIGALLVLSFAVVDTYYAKTGKKIYKILYLFVILTGILGTGTRSAFIVMAFYYAMKFVPYLLNLHGTIRKKTILWIGAGCIGLAVLISQFHNQIVAKIMTFGEANLYSTRLLVYLDSIKLIIERPLLGRSAFRFQAFDVERAHNYILESLVQTGVIGTIIYATAWWKVCKRIFGAHRTTANNVVRTFIIMILVHGLVEPNMFSCVGDTLVWFMIGVGVNTFNSEHTSANR